MTRNDPSRTIAAPTGTTLNAKSWLTEAPLRMLMNNLHPDVAERPQELVLRCDRRNAQAPGRRPDPAGAVGQAGGRVPHPRRRTARADRQFQPGAALGQLGPLQRAG
ncbi:hypothetical protein G6F63_015868 [Rhizopus arrhizus]|nr:hypothetical protein G6F63_015868 [Rhizopus arrhizus]